MQRLQLNNQELSLDEDFQDFDVSGWSLLDLLSCSPCFGRTLMLLFSNGEIFYERKSSKYYNYYMLSEEKESSLKEEYRNNLLQSRNMQRIFLIGFKLFKRGWKATASSKDTNIVKEILSTVKYHTVDDRKSQIHLFPFEGTTTTFEYFNIPIGFLKIEEKCDPYLFDLENQVIREEPCVMIQNYLQGKASMNYERTEIIVNKLRKQAETTGNIWKSNLEGLYLMGGTTGGEIDFFNDVLEKTYAYEVESQKIIVAYISSLSKEQHFLLTVKTRASALDVVAMMVSHCEKEPSDVSRSFVIAQYLMENPYIRLHNDFPISLRELLKFAKIDLKNPLGTKELSIYLNFSSMKDFGYVERPKSTSVLTAKLAGNNIISVGAKKEKFKLKYDNRGNVLVEEEVQVEVKKSTSSFKTFDTGFKDITIDVDPVPNFDELPFELDQGLIEQRESFQRKHGIVNLKSFEELGEVDVLSLMYFHCPVFEDSLISMANFSILALTSNIAACFNLSPKDLEEARKFYSGEKIEGYEERPKEGEYSVVWVYNEKAITEETARNIRDYYITKLFSKLKPDDRIIYAKRHPLLKDISMSFEIGKVNKRLSMLSDAILFPKKKIYTVTTMLSSYYGRIPSRYAVSKITEPLETGLEREFLFEKILEMANSKKYNYDYEIASLAIRLNQIDRFLSSFKDILKSYLGYQEIGSPASSSISNSPSDKPLIKEIIEKRREKRGKKKDEGGTVQIVRGARAGKKRAPKAEVESPFARANLQQTPTPVSYLYDLRGIYEEEPEHIVPSYEDLEEDGFRFFNHHLDLKLKQPTEEDEPEFVNPQDTLKQAEEADRKLIEQAEEDDRKLVEHQRDKEENDEEEAKSDNVEEKKFDHKLGRNIYLWLRRYKERAIEKIKELKAFRRYANGNQDVEQVFSILIEEARVFLDPSVIVDREKLRSVIPDFTPGRGGTQVMSLYNLLKEFKKDYRRTAAARSQGGQSQLALMEKSIKEVMKKLNRTPLNIESIELEQDLFTEAMVFGKIKAVEIYRHLLIAYTLFINKKKDMYKNLMMRIIESTAF